MQNKIKKEKTEKKFPKEEIAAMSIYEKILAIRKDVRYLQKNTAGFNCKYTPSSVLIGKIRPRMDELNVLLVPEILDIKSEVVQNKNERIVTLDMKFSWINGDKPEEKLVCMWKSLGQNQNEKGFGCAVTYGTRYFLLDFFNIPNDHADPDYFESEYYGDGDENNPSQSNYHPQQTQCPAQSPTPKTVSLPIQLTPEQEAEKDRQTKELNKARSEIYKEMALSGTNPDEIKSFCENEKIPIDKFACTIEQLRKICVWLKSKPRISNGKTVTKVVDTPVATQPSIPSASAPAPQAPTPTQATPTPATPATPTQVVPQSPVAQATPATPATPDENVDKTLYAKIKLEIERTAVDKEAINVYCAAHNFPIEMKLWKTTHLSCVLKHLQSLPSKRSNPTNAFAAKAAAAVAK